MDSKPGGPDSLRFSKHSGSDKSRMDLSEIDEILDRPLKEWTLEQIQLFQSLEKRLTRHRKTFIQAQFIQDQIDIRDNILGQQWYKKITERPVQSAIKSFLKQFRVMTFSLTRQSDILRMMLTISLEEANLKLQYYNSPDKFLYYLYLEPISDDNSTDGDTRAYLAHNHPKIKIKQKVPDIENAYELLGRDLARIPAGIFMRLVAEIVLFYEDTETVLKTPISQETEWSLSDAFEK